MPSNHTFGNCHHDKDLLLAAAEQRLTAKEHGEVDAVLAECPECQADYAQMCLLTQATAAWQDAPVPSWARDRAIPRSERPRLHWMNWASLGASMAALALVALKVDVQVGADGTHVRFGGGPATTVAATDLDRRLQDFALKQSADVERRLAEYEDVNRDTTRELLKVVAMQNRRERRQDLETLLTYWQDQHENETRRLERKVNSVSSEQVQSKRVLNELLRNLNDTDTPAKTESL